MIRRVRAVALSAVFLASTSASASGCRPTGDPLLWTVRGASGTFHLLGTLHWGIPAAELDPAVHRALSESKSVVLESLPAGEGPSAWLPEGQTLDKLLSRKAWGEVRARLGDRMPVEDLRLVKPPAVLMLLSQKGKDGSVSMDRDIIEQARRAGKELVGLETSEGTQALERAATPRYLSRYLEAIDEARAAREEERFVVAYCSGDVPALEALRKPWGPEQAEFDRILVTERNRRWLGALSSRARSGGAFIAVGVNHLIGPDGLLRLLEAEGHAVTRSRASP